MSAHQGFESDPREISQSRRSLSFCEDLSRWGARGSAGESRSLPLPRWVSDSEGARKLPFLMGASAGSTKAPHPRWGNPRQRGERRNAPARSARAFGLSHGEARARGARPGSPDGARGSMPKLRHFRRGVHGGRHAAPDKMVLYYARALARVVQHTSCARPETTPRPKPRRSNAFRGALSLWKARSFRPDACSPMFEGDHDASERRAGVRKGQRRRGRD